MDLFRNPVKDEQTLKIIVRHDPNPIQVWFIYYTTLKQIAQLNFCSNILETADNSFFNETGI